MNQIHFSIGWLVTEFKGKGVILVYSLIALVLDNHLITNLWANMVVDIIAMEEASAQNKIHSSALEAVRPSNELIQSKSSIYLVTILELIQWLSSSAVIEDGGNLKDKMNQRIASTNIRYKEDMNLCYILLITCI